MDLEDFEQPPGNEENWQFWRDALFERPFPQHECWVSHIDSRNVVLQNGEYRLSLSRHDRYRYLHTFRRVFPDDSENDIVADMLMRLTHCTYGHAASLLKDIELVEGRSGDRSEVNYVVAKCRVSVNGFASNIVIESESVYPEQYPRTDALFKCALSRHRADRSQALDQGPPDIGLVGARLGKYSSELRGAIGDLRSVIDEHGSKDSVQLQKIYICLTDIQQRLSQNQITDESASEMIILLRELRDHAVNKSDIRAGFESEIGAGVAKALTAMVGIGIGYIIALALGTLR